MEKMPGILLGLYSRTVRKSHGPAPDGEEYFAMALFLLQTAGETERAFIIIPKGKGYPT